MNEYQVHNSLIIEKKHDLRFDINGKIALINLVILYIKKSFAWRNGLEEYQVIK